MPPNELALRLVALENKIKNLQGNVSYLNEVVNLLTYIIADNKMTLHINDPNITKKLEEILKLLGRFNGQKEEDY